MVSANNVPERCIQMSPLTDTRWVEMIVTRTGKKEISWHQVATHPPRPRPHTENRDQGGRYGENSGD